MTDAKFCAGCGDDSPLLRPWRPHYHPWKFATPKFCPNCIPEKKRSPRAPLPYFDPDTGKVDAGRWAANQTEMVAAENYYRRQSSEAYRGMIRTEPLPPQERIPTFVWDIPNPVVTLVREIRQGMRYMKLNW